MTIIPLKLYGSLSRLPYSHLEKYYNMYRTFACQTSTIAFSIGVWQSLVVTTPDIYIRMPGSDEFAKTVLWDDYLRIRPQNIRICRITISR